MEMAEHKECKHYEDCCYRNDIGGCPNWCAQFKHKDDVRVVRCKDCRFSAQHDPYEPMECMKWTTKWGVAYTTPDGHCHKGERKKDGE